MKNELSRLERFACAIAAHDPDVLARCGSADRHYVVNLMISLALSFFFILGIATYALSMFTDIEVAIAVSLLVTAILIQYDRAFLGSEAGFPMGVGGFASTLRKAARLMPRASISVFLAVGLLAMPLELAIQGGKIREILDRNHRENNEPYFEAMRQFDSDQAARVKTMESTVEALEEQKDKFSRLGALVKERTEWIGKRDQQELEALKEERGLDGYDKGTGDRWSRAMLLKNQAQAQVKAKDAELSAIKKEIEVLKTDIARARENVPEQRTLQEARRSYSDALKSRLSFNPMHDGILLRWLALKKLYADPKLGSEAISLGWVIKGSIVFLELLPLLMKTFLTPANLIYPALSRSHTMTQIVRIVHTGNADIRKSRKSTSLSVIDDDMDDPA